jgi:3-deoxy-manno-octulosonate cytidylyltransferase (CMP-KDO synthetase)
VIIATDDQRVESVAKTFQANVEMTPSDISSGSERVGFVAKDIEAEIVVNLQGDEPFISTEAVDEAIIALKNNSEINISTLACPLESEDEWHNPSVVKVLIDKEMNAIYFSRCAIPSFRDNQYHSLSQLKKHIGAYIFRKEFLMQFLKWEETPLEKAEKLEQLRILENGYKIRVVETEKNSYGVDTPEDVTYIETLIKNKGMSF